MRSIEDPKKTGNPGRVGDLERLPVFPELPFAGTGGMMSGSLDDEEPAGWFLIEKVCRVTYNRSGTQDTISVWLRERTIKKGLCSLRGALALDCCLDLALELLELALQQLLLLLERLDTELEGVDLLGKFGIHDLFFLLHHDCADAHVHDRIIGEILDLFLRPLGFADSQFVLGFLLEDGLELLLELLEHAELVLDFG
jgi:hypothetical protein